MWIFACLIARSWSMTCSTSIDNCKDCEDDGISCKLCFEGFYLDNADQTCKACGVENCKICSSDQTSCTECKEGYNLDSNNQPHQCTKQTCNVQNCELCVSQKPNECSKCSEGFYLDNADQTCKACGVENCKICLSDQTSCTECKEGYNLDSNNQPHQCTKQTCNVQNCELCVSQKPNECSKCSEGFYLDNADQTCKACGVENCKICSSDQTSCTECKEGYNLDSNNQPHQCTKQTCNVQNCELCVSQKPNECSKCSEGFYLDNADQTCKACGVENCKICSSDQTSCTECKEGYNLDSNNQPHQCTKQTCNVQNCELCVSQKPNECSKCSEGFYLDNADQTCKACGVENCKICSSDQTSCTECKEGYNLDSNNQPHQCTKQTCNVQNCELCVSQKPNECSKCSEGFYLDNADQTCKACGVENCKICSSDQTSCTECKEGYNLDSNNQPHQCTKQTCNVQNCELCVSQKPNECSKCSEGFYLDNADQTCKACGVENCKICSSDQTSCTECKEGYNLDSNNQPHQCTKQTCNVQNCELCVSQKPNECSKCSEGFYLDNADQTCKACGVENCKICSSDQTSCTECKEGYNLDSNNQPHQCTKQTCNVQNCELCVSQKPNECSKCSEGFYLDNADQTCKACGVENCKICSSDQTSCTECKEGYNLDSNNQPHQCTKQTCNVQNCELCVSQKPNECSKCSEGFYLDNADQTCKACGVENCKICSSDQTSCTECKEGYESNTDSTKCILITYECPDNSQYPEFVGCSQCNIKFEDQSSIEDIECVTCQENYVLNTTTKRCVLIETILTPNITSTSTITSSSSNEDINEILPPSQQIDITIPGLNQSSTELDIRTPDEAEKDPSKDFVAKVGQNNVVIFKDNGASNLYFESQDTNLNITFKSSNEDMVTQTGVIAKNETTITIGSHNIQLNLQGSGNVNLHSSDSLEEVTILTTKIDNEALTINSNSSVVVEQMSLFRSSKFSTSGDTKASINVIKVQQGSSPTLSNCNIVKEILVGVNASLTLSSDVDISGTSANISAPNNSIPSRSAFVFEVEDPAPPSNINVVPGKLNTYLADEQENEVPVEKTFMIVSRISNCAKWKSNVNLDDQNYRSIKCVKIEGTNLEQLVVSSNPQQNKKLSPGAIAGIVIACVVVVAIIAGVSIYVSKKGNQSLGVESLFGDELDSLAI
ncbi:hypothetical protein TRFO_13337 [Tritrichomonas foetus]|uniref:EGF-like domain-containing protein n=1 Tax=Tritrichomonas foetus TaxID=1144522 RepID=A0A1J4KY57_9EUKA|nr:hypothetical protein TRFO_13337 [Tritrichomonas foetus]|eukprot:OHT16187.1 hypothetical protein TRFO_13337 [Tritrichomonas foetus]